MLPRPHNLRHGRQGIYSSLAAVLLMLIQALTMAAGPDLARLRELALQRYDEAAERRLGEWQDLLQSAANRSIQEQLRHTNDFFNSRIRWATDEEVYGSEDYWATPLEILGLRAGDCEDFSIAKYVTLLALGAAPESLRLVYVNAQLPGGASQAHMVLAWYATPSSVPLILDNINGALLPADQRRDLRPVFSFNADALWIGGRSKPSAANPRARLSRWERVLMRLSDEGFLTKG